jgi:hypothetical protein
VSAPRDSWTLTTARAGTWTSWSGAADSRWRATEGLGPWALWRTGGFSATLIGGVDGSSSGRRMIQTNLQVAWRMFPEIYKDQVTRHPDACSGQCVSWSLFDVDLTYSPKCKGDETQMAGMSNVRAFPAVVIDGDGHCSALSVAPSNRYCYMHERGEPCLGDVPITSEVSRRSGHASQRLTDWLVVKQGPDWPRLSDSWGTCISGRDQSAALLRLQPALSIIDAIKVCLYGRVSPSAWFSRRAGGASGAAPSTPFT